MTTAQLTVLVRIKGVFSSVILIGILLPERILLAEKLQDTIRLVDRLLFGDLRHHEWICNLTWCWLGSCYLHKNARVVVKLLHWLRFVEIMPSSTTLLVGLQNLAVVVIRLVLMTLRRTPRRLFFLLLYFLYCTRLLFIGNLLIFFIANLLNDCFAFLIYERFKVKSSLIGLIEWSVIHLRLLEVLRYTAATQLFPLLEGRDEGPLAALAVVIAHTKYVGS